jgi:hypothetical protein
VNESLAVVLLIYLTVAVPQAGSSNSAAEGVNFCNFSIASETKNSFDMNVLSTHFENHLTEMGELGWHSHYCAWATGFRIWGLLSGRREMLFLSCTCPDQL